MDWRHFFLTDPFEGVRLVPEDLQGWGSDDPIFGQVIERVRPSLIVEVGSWKGRSAVNMARLCERLNLQTTLICVDTWLGSLENYAKHTDVNRGLHEALKFEAGYPTLHRQFMSNILHAGLRERIIPLPVTSTIAARLLAEKAVQADLVYLDASHDYEDCSRDLENYWPLVREGGILFGDDYIFWPGVTQAVDQFVARHGLIGIKRAGKFAVSKGGSLAGIV